MSTRRRIRAARVRRARQQDAQQLALEQLYPCPRCHGTGYATARQTRGPITITSPERCRVCRGEGRVPYNPNDHTEIPY